jgi:hypothetical protein
MGCGRCEYGASPCRGLIPGPPPAVFSAPLLTPSRGQEAHTDRGIRTQERAVPGVPRQQPIDQPPAPPHDLAGQLDHRRAERPELHPQQLPPLGPTQQLSGPARREHASILPGRAPRRARSATAPIRGGRPSRRSTWRRLPPEGQADPGDEEDGPDRIIGARGVRQAGQADGDAGRGPEHVSSLNGCHQRGLKLKGRNPNRRPDTWAKNHWLI